MFTFKEFVAEEVLNEANISASGKQAERHISKYMNKEMLSKTEYTLSKDHQDLEAGSKVRVHSVVQQNGKYHAIVRREGESHAYMIPVSKLKKPHNQTVDTRAAETRHLEHFHNQIEKLKSATGQQTIPMRLNGRIQHVAGVRQIPGNPKADFALQDRDGKDIYFISHKGGADAKDFHGFGGVTLHSNTPVVKDFTQKIKTQFPDGIKGNTVAIKLDSDHPEHRTLILKTMYGSQHGSEQRGVNNVDAIHQGHMNLEKVGSHYEIRSNNVQHNGEVPEKTDMMIYARHSAGRSDLGLKDTRISMSSVHARKVAHWIK